MELGNRTGYGKKELFLWFCYRVRYVIIKKLFRRRELLICARHGSKEYITQEEANLQIGNALREGKPYLACRLGTVEAFALRTFYFNHGKNKEKAARQLRECAGFFPENDTYMEKFCGLMLEDMKQADLFGTAYEQLIDYFVKYGLSANTKIMSMGSIIPITMEHPWTAMLQGRRVLVVHPFSVTIQSQYEKRTHLFKNKEVLPEFDLITYQAVQTSAGVLDERFQTWFDALRFMEGEISQIDYDVALIGCGAYGLPLAAWIKRQGKIAIHIGGGLQLLFGIKGKRWDEEQEVSSLYNPYWVYPSAMETPQGASMVEGGCYWGGSQDETM